METLWFCLVALTLITYVVLDGYDLGAGAVHLWVARTDAERRLALRSIAPFWDGNELWLVTAGATLFFVFPGVYAASFSGFYLPLMIVLWLLMLRGIAIEFRRHLDSPVWKPFWDSVFCLASILLSVFLGAALGNVIRGVSLDESGMFFLPLWTDFDLRGRVGILDWYTLTVGIFALVTLVQHGALWIALKTEDLLQRRARRVAAVAWWFVAGLTLLVTVFTMRVQPQIPSNLEGRPWGYVFPAIAWVGLGAVAVFRRRNEDRQAFLASCTCVAGLLASAAFGIFPFVLPSTRDPSLGLTIHNTAASRYGLTVGLAWWVPGVMLVIGYFVYIHRRFAGKVKLEDDEEGY